MSKFCYDYPRPALAADCIVIAKDQGQPKLLLIQRLHDPYKDSWAFPGGFMDMDETVEQAARRELIEETGLVIDDFKQFKTVSKVDRDPRYRVVSVVFYTIVDSSSALKPKAADDAKAVEWWPIEDLPSLAFDHGATIEELLQRITI